MKSKTVWIVYDGLRSPVATADSIREARAKICEHIESACSDLKNIRIEWSDKYNCRVFYQNTDFPGDLPELCFDYTLIPNTPRCDPVERFIGEVETHIVGEVAKKIAAQVPIIF